MAWASIRDFAGFRGAETAEKRKAPLGRLAVPPAPESEGPPLPPEPQPKASAADRVRERLASLRSGGAGGAGSRVPGIVAPAAAVPARRPCIGPERPAPAGQQSGPASSVDASGAEVLVFRCTGARCRHEWVSGRGATSFEQICKCCGASVVGVLSKGAVLCEVAAAEPPR